MLLYRKVRSQANETQQRLRDIEDFIDKRVKFFVPLPSSLEKIRLMARSTYKSYVFYRPEFKVMQCLYKYARTEYPEIMDLLRVDEFGRSGHSAFRTFLLITDNLMKLGGLGQLNKQGKRDTSKISPNHSFGERIRKRSTGPVNWSPSSAQQMFRLRIKTEPKKSIAAAPTPNVSILPRSPSIALQTAELLENAVIEHATGIPGKSGSPLTLDGFNMEHFVLRAIGLEPESIIEGTPLYCGKEYVKDFLRRFTYSVILA